MTTSDKTYIIAEKSGMQIRIISVMRLKSSTVCRRLNTVLPTVRDK